MITQRRLGILTPSSNSALEPLTSEIVAQAPGVSAHFSRFRVTEISMSEQALSQFDTAPVLQAAHLLADAEVSVIGWSGTSAGWLGFDRDRELCRLIESETGIRATTSVLALLELIQLAGIDKVALYTPYTEDVQLRIIEHLAQAGIECVAEHHLGIARNFDFALVEPADILQACDDMLAASQAQAVITLCTNLRAAQLATELESRHAAMLLDTVSTVLWKMMKMIDQPTDDLLPWGRMFRY